MPQGRMAYWRACRGAMKSVSLGICQTPLQAMNVVEAARGDGVEPVLIVPYRDESARRGVARLLDGLGVRQVTYLSSSGLSGRLLPVRAALRALRLRGKVEGIYFGTYTTWVSVFINLVGAREHVLVDDGQKTINILTAPHLVGLDRSLPWPLSRNYVHSARLYTFYDQLAREVGRQAQPNRLAWVTKQLAGVGNAKPLGSGEILFIGTHIEDAYGPFERDLARVVTEAGQRPLTYVLHRRDNEQRMRELGRRLGFEVVRFDLPLELVFNQLWLAHRPEVWTFGTTATDTLLAMHEELRVRVFRLEPGSFTRARTGEAFASIYAHQEGKPRVDLVPLPPLL